MIGSIVKVVDEGWLYSTYKSFFKENRLLQWEPYFTYGRLLTPGRLYTVVGEGIHHSQKATLYLIQDNVDQTVFILRSTAIKVVVETLSPEAFYEELGFAE